MALKSIDDVDENGFDNKLFATEIAYLAKTLEIFLGIITKRQEVKTLLNLESLRRMIPLRLITLKNLKKK